MHDFSDIAKLEFSPEAKRLFGMSEQDDASWIPSSQWHAVANAKKPIDDWHPQQQRNAHENVSNEGQTPLFFDSDRREKKAKEHAVYQRYVAAVPRWERKPADPQTPDKDLSYSRRNFDTRVQIWKKSLYRWEERYEEEKARANLSMVLRKVFEDFELSHYEM